MDLLEHFSDDEVETILNGELSDMDIETFWQNLQELNEEDEEDAPNRGKAKKKKRNSKKSNAKKDPKKDPDDDEFKKLFE